VAMGRGVWCNISCVLARGGGRSRRVRGGGCDSDWA
jgi:hypothetical protein